MSVIFQHKHFSALEPGRRTAVTACRIAITFFFDFTSQIYPITIDACTLSEKLAIGRGRTPGRNDFERMTTSKRERRCRSASVLHVNFAAGRVKDDRVRVTCNRHCYSSNARTTVTRTGRVDGKGGELPSLSAGSSCYLFWEKCAPTAPVHAALLRRRQVFEASRRRAIKPRHLSGARRNNHAHGRLSREPRTHYAHLLLLHRRATRDPLPPIHSWRHTLFTRLPSPLIHASAPRRPIIIYRYIVLLFWYVTREWLRNIYKELDGNKIYIR